MSELSLVQEIEIELVVNGERVRRRVSPRVPLSDFIRDHLQLTGTHVGCEQGACGACSVSLDATVVRSCLVLAVQARGSVLETIEGAHASRRIARLQEAFFERAALQCGFCTPGMLMTAAELLKRNARPTRDEIRAHLAGNYCRCTGYEAIVDAVERAALA